MKRDGFIRIKYTLGSAALKYYFVWNHWEKKSVSVLTVDLVA